MHPCKNDTDCYSVERKVWQDVTAKQMMNMARPVHTASHDADACGHDLTDPWSD